VAAPGIALEVRAQAAEGRAHLVGFVGDLPVGEAQDVEAGGGMDLVSLGHTGLLGRRRPSVSTTRP
jgi:hypothetical protein